MRMQTIAILAAATFGLVLGQAAQAGLCRLLNRQKEQVSVPERVDDIDTKYLLSIEWGSYAGRKSRLGVLPVDNTSSSSSFSVTTSAGNVDYSSTSGLGL